MNLIRTIQAEEDPAWVALFFVPGPHRGNPAPTYPFQVPLPFHLKHDQIKFLYFIYRRAIVGYGLVKYVALRSTAMPVGTQLRPVRPGHTVVIDGPYQHMPSSALSVEVRGFTGVRYTGRDLHTLTPNSLRTELSASGVAVY